jgi:hypothetical protein
MTTLRQLSVGLLLLVGGALFAQDKPQDPPKPEAPKPDEKFRPEAPKAEEEADLTPEKAMQMLKEVRELQELAAELLNASAQGKALETEQALLSKLKGLLKDEEKANPQAAQKKILEKIERLMGKSEGSQKDAVDKMGEIIRRVKQGQGQGQGKPQPGQQQKQQQQQQQQGKRPQQPSNPATSPYDPGRNSDPINKFRSTADRTGRWGDLPARLREPILNGKRDLDDYPPEFQQLLKEYFKELSGEK